MERYQHSEWWESTEDMDISKEEERGEVFERNLAGLEVTWLG